MDPTPADNFISWITSRFSKPYSKGILLILMVIIAMAWANSENHESYHHFFDRPFSIGFEGFALTEPLHVWINDALMAIFFFSIGLEIKREIIEGELSSLRKAALPIFAAFGGMLLPALLFFSINYGTEAQNAWGIPMATDIAFALGLLALLGTKVPNKIKVFLTSLATVDDIGAILVIALLLTPFIDVKGLVAGGVYLSIMIAANVLGVRNMWFYLIVGVLGLWIAIFLSGLHATIAGVLGALTIPANKKINKEKFKADLQMWTEEFARAGSATSTLLSHKQEELIDKIARNVKQAGTPLQLVERKIAPLINFFILPLFALANAGVHIEGNIFEMLGHPISIGIMVGLVLGKVIGVGLFSFLSVKSGLASLPVDVNWGQIIGVGFFAGIGFTMSIFIAELSLTNPQLLANAKLSILVASCLSAVVGLLRFTIGYRRPIIYT